MLERISNQAQRTSEEEEMTQRELDIFICRGLVGIVRMIEQRAHGGFPKIAKEIVEQNKPKIEQFISDVTKFPSIDEYNEVDEREFKRWLLQGLTTLSEFVERLAILGGNEKKIALYRQLHHQMRQTIQCLEM